MSLLEDQEEMCECFLNKSCESEPQKVQAQSGTRTERYELLAVETSDQRLCLQFTLASFTWACCLNGTCSFVWIFVCVKMFDCLCVLGCDLLSDCLCVLSCGLLYT